MSPYHFLCDGQLTQCVPQPGSTTRLDAQGDKIMHRVVYRNRGGVESIVMLHSVNTAVGAGGERWYEMRLDAQPPARTCTSRAPTRRTTTTAGWAARGSTATATSRWPSPTAAARTSRRSRRPCRPPRSSGATNIKVAGVTGANINLAPGRKINIGTGATLETGDRRERRHGRRDRHRASTLTAPLAIPHASASTVSNAAFMCVAPECLPVGQRYTARAARRPAEPDDLPRRRDRRRHQRRRRLALGGLVEPRDGPERRLHVLVLRRLRRRVRAPAARSSAAPARSACRPAGSTRVPAPDAEHHRALRGRGHALHRLRPDRGRRQLHRRHRLGRRDALARHRHRRQRHVLGSGTHDYAEKGRYTVKTSITGLDGSIAEASFVVANLSTTAPGTIGGTVPGDAGADARRPGRSSARSRRAWRRSTRPRRPRT